MMHYHEPQSRRSQPFGALKQESPCLGVAPLQIRGRNQKGVPQKEFPPPIVVVGSMLV